MTDIFARMPRGASLPDDVWQTRHRIILWFALGCSGAVILFGLTQGVPFRQLLIEGAVAPVIIGLSWFLPASNRIRASLASAALITVAAVAVYISGTVEAHFLFFIMVPIVALYEDWAPFATAVVLVFAHHGIFGLVAPDGVYNHDEALAAPFLWSVIHVALFVAICATSIVHWRIHENARADERLLVGKLARQALHDPLTGVGNRLLFDNRLELALDERRRTGAPLAMIMLDIDGFKVVNDVHGHAVGDDLLGALAESIQQCIRPGDTSARFGGDEFAILLPGADEAAAMEVATRIDEAIGVRTATKYGRTRISVSMGVAAAARQMSDAGLMAHADRAMYTAKHRGRGRIVVYRPADEHVPDGLLSVNVADAREWAHYMRALRTEIGLVKASGGLPGRTRGPDSVRRTMESVLAAIDWLPLRVADAKLPLPETGALEEFVFHQQLVQDWADSLAHEGVLTVRRSVGADLFWSNLYTTVGGLRPPEVLAG